MAFRVFKRLRDLLDVDATNIGNGKVPVYRTSSGKHEYETVSGSSAASDVTIADSGGYFTGTNVEDVLQEVGADVGSIPTDYVAKALYDANTILKADSDNTPAALTMGASTILARLAAGNIVAATPSELRTLLALVVGTNVQAWDADLDAIAALADPNADRILFWDDSAGAYKLLTAGTGLTITDTTITASGGGGTKRVRVRLDVPDSSGNGYPALTTSNGFSNVRRIVPAFTKDVVGSWEGTVEIPADYSSGGAIICSYVCNATTGVYTNQISTAVVADGVTEDTAYTAETAVDTTVPGTAKLRKDVSTTLTTTPVAGSTLNVKVAHNGTAGNDTLAVDMLLWDCHFSYVSA